MNNRGMAHVELDRIGIGGSPILRLSRRVGDGCPQYDPIMKRFTELELMAPAHGHDANKHCASAIPVRSPRRAGAGALCSDIYPPIVSCTRKPIVSPGALDGLDCRGLRLGEHIPARLGRTIDHHR